MLKVRTIDVQPGDAFRTTDGHERVVETEDGLRSYWRNPANGNRGSVHTATIQREWLRLGTRATAAAHRALAKLDKAKRAAQVRR